MSQPLVATGLAFGITKAYSSMNETDIPNATLIQHAALLGATKYVVDMSIENDPIQKAIGTGVVFAGLCYVFLKDETWMMNGALGVGASYIADIIVPTPKKEEEEQY